MNNKVTISGKITSIQFSHEMLGEMFYLANVCVERLSGTTDEIPVMVSDRVNQFTEEDVDEYVEVIGQFRSYNKCDGSKKKLFLFVFANEIIFTEPGAAKNEISIEGFICKQPTFRQTPFGRQISDVMIAVNRAYGKSDYIPCVVWGRNARFASNLNIGDYVYICGRIQSREYIKENQVHVAYEISVQIIEK